MKEKVASRSSTQERKITKYHRVDVLYQGKRKESAGGLNRGFYDKYTSFLIFKILKVVSPTVLGKRIFFP
jgi:hypothetical protein